MKKNYPLTGVWVGALVTMAVTAVNYLVNQLAALPFAPFDLFDWISRILPGDLLTFGIDLMIDSLLFLGGEEALSSAKTAEQLMAVGMFLTYGVVLGGVLYLLRRQWVRLPFIIAMLLVSIIGGLPIILIHRAVTLSKLPAWMAVGWLVLLFLLWSVIFVWAVWRLEQVGEETAVVQPSSEQRKVERLNRRQFLIQLGAGTATITVAGTGLGAFLAKAERQRQLEQIAAQGGVSTNITAFPNANDPLIPALGTRAEYTPVSEHYQVFLRTEPSLIEEANWVLPITGMVESPKMLTLTDIHSSYPSQDQFVTLSCISGRVGTSLISTTMWTGVSAQALLADLGVQEGAKYLDITSEDGFHESVSLDLINADARIMFCYAWDGEPLPKDHGFPLRIWIPDLYGMKQPKWITGIEVTETYRQGYWVERNWSESAKVRTTSVIDTVALDAVIDKGLQRLVPIGGIAWAGDRQISRVEVQVDNGEWQEAKLRTPLSETTWVLWRFDWPFADGEHTFSVRCYEADGSMQIAEKMPQRPDGATGIHSFEI
jgi:DMSO/TMAO reductase YedYZ molybdopterin-dependent catalytic subunit